MPKLGELDDKSLQQIKAEFNRQKKNTPFSHYKITEYIDSGSFSRVYLVQSRFGSEKFAIRISDETYSQQFEHKNSREIYAVKYLMKQKQDHIVEYLMDFTVDVSLKNSRSRKYCALMPFLCPLSKNEDSGDDIEIAVRCGSDLLPLLETCMRNKIIHRDIKPQNILYNENIRDIKGFMLGDFGEARDDENSNISPVGTPATVAPEIIGYDEEIAHDHHLSDMYSLGIVMYYYLNGRTYPFENDHEKRVKTKGALPEPRYGSKRLKALVVKATQYYPKDRFASPMEMFKELQQCDEYKVFILRRSMEAEDTVRPKHDIVAENTRLKAENVALKKMVIAQKRELQDAKKQPRDQKTISSDQSTKNAVKEALANQKRKWEFYRGEPLIYTSAGIMLIIQLLMIALMIEIRFVGHNSYLINKLRLFEPIEHIMSLGDGWAHLTISVLCCSFIFVYMLLTQIWNEQTWKGILGGFLGSFAVQSVFILLYALINPPFNTRIEQCCWFIVVNLFSVALSYFMYFIGSEDYEVDLDDFFDIIKYIVIASAIGLIPSFTILLPSWWGLIITGILDGTVAYLVLAALNEHEDAFPELSVKENSIRKTNLLMPCEFMMPSLQLILQLLMMGLMVYIRIICKNADVIARMESSSLISWVMSRGNGWAHFILSILFCALVFVCVILTRMWNGETWRGILAGFVGSFSVQTAYLLLYAWINPPFNTRIEQFCWFMAVNLFSVWISCFFCADDGTKTPITIVGGTILAAVVSAIGLIPSFTVLLPGWWGLIFTGVLNLAAVAVTVVGILYLIYTLRKQSRLKSLTDET